MKIMKTLAISAMLAMPMLASATTITSGELGLGSTLSGSGYDALGNGGSFVIVNQMDILNDIWTISVDPGYTAEIAFKNNPLSVQGFKIWDIDNFTILSPSEILTGLTGIRSFFVSGKASGISGGAYSVGTIVSAVPVPAAAWLMLSGLIGSLALGRSKDQVEA